MYFPGYLPESGGGYTFEQDILAALVELANQSHHEFFLFTENISIFDKQITFSGNFEIIKLKKVKRFQNILRKARHFCLKYGWTNLAKVMENPLRKSTAKYKIEFVWFPTPIYSPIDIPYIATVWDIQHRVQPWFPEVGIESIWNEREKYSKEFLERAVYIITPNQASQNELALYYQIPLDRFLKFPHPVPRISLQSQIRIDAILNKYNLVKQEYLFYPAQFWPHKNHINLLSALKLLRDESDISIPLVLVGSDKGNLQYVLNKAEEMGIKNSIQYLGFVPRDDLIGLYQGAFALTFLSLFGPENLPPLESFVCGCPVIAACVAGAKEQYNDAALLVDGTNPIEIANAIKSLFINPKLRDSLIKKGYKRSKEFTAVDYVKGVITAMDKFETVRQNWGVDYQLISNTFTKR